MRYRYLIAGFINTIIGYSLGIVLYYALIPYINLIFIMCLVNIISILVSFLNYKLFVFKSKGYWKTELLKCYIVYGFGSVVSIIIIKILVDFYNVKFWIAQAIAIVLVIIISFFMHKKFTFTTN
jgi:putative flippase GtrA